MAKPDVRDVSMPTCSRAGSTHDPGPLVEFVIDRDGARMVCRDCRSSAAVSAEDVLEQAVTFQYLHLDCDPSLRC